MTDEVVHDDPADPPHAGEVGLPDRLRRVIRLRELLEQATRDLEWIERHYAAAEALEPEV